MKTWIIGYLLEFEDGSPEYSPLQECENEKECERIADLIPAIAYRGERRVKSAQLVWMRKMETSNA